MITRPDKLMLCRDVTNSFYAQFFFKFLEKLYNF